MILQPDKLQYTFSLKNPNPDGSFGLFINLFKFSTKFGEIERMRL